MYTGQFVFAQLMDHLPWHVFRRCVARYGGDRKVKSFSCLDQFRCLAFAQLTWRESLRDIEACLRAQSAKLYHLGFRCQQISRNTMANANAERDWRIYADFAQKQTAPCTWLPPRNWFAKVREKPEKIQVDNAGKWLLSMPHQ